MKPRIKVKQLSLGKHKYWVIIRNGCLAHLADVYRHRSFDKAFWHRM